MNITESISPSGTCLTIEGSGIILCQITELITAKVGGDNQTSLLCFFIYIYIKKYNKLVFIKKKIIYIYIYFFIKTSFLCFFIYIYI